MTLDEKLQHLQTGALSLAAETETLVPQIRETLAGNTKLPDGCPSKESMADLQLNEIRQKLKEVHTALEMVEDAVWGKYGYLPDWRKNMQ